MAEPSFAEVENVWSSERLIYRTVNQQDYDFFCSEISNNPINLMLPGPMIPKQSRRKKPQEWVDSWKKNHETMMLDVTVCLRPDADSNGEHWHENSKDCQADAVSIGGPVDSTIVGRGAAIQEALGGGGGAMQTRGQTQHEPKPIGFLAVSPLVYRPDAKNRACKLSISIAASYQNSGYGTEAVNWAVEWAFRRANMQSVHLACVEYNKGGHRCYRKCGFTLDGRQRQCYWHNRKWYDLCLFSILEDEWEDMQTRKARQRPRSGKPLR